MTFQSRCLLLVMGAVAMPIASDAQSGGLPPAQVEVVTAENRLMAATVEIPGVVVSMNDASIAAEVEGVVTELADVGTEVARGDVIAKLNAHLISASVAAARANVGRLEADLAYRERLVERNEGMAANASKIALDEARSQRDVIRFQLEEAQAQSQRAQAQLDRTTIRAPFAGHVVERLAAVGEYVSVGEDMVRLVDTGRREISVPVPIALVKYLAPGSTLSIAGDQLDYPVRTIVPVGDNRSRTVEVRLDAQAGQHLVGTPVQVSIPSAEAVETVTVPRDALVQRAGTAFIYRVGEDGSAEQIQADIVSTVGNWVGVRGIEPGDQIIVRGAERLQPGQPVAISGNE